jgi:hypothetical protein
VTPRRPLLIATASAPGCRRSRPRPRMVSSFRTLDDTRELMRRWGPRPKPSSLAEDCSGSAARRKVRVPRDNRASDGHADGAPAR